MIRHAALLLAVLPIHATADPAEVVSAEAAPGAQGWTVTVTLRHGDTGWDDYADGWRVIGPNGDVIATRPLAHPHVDEQPFARSLRGIDLPDGVRSVQIESSTNTTGWGGDRLTLDIPR